MLFVSNSIKIETQIEIARIKGGGLDHLGGGDRDPSPPRVDPVARHGIFCVK